MRHQKQELLVYIVYILLGEGPFLQLSSLQLFEDQSLDQHHGISSIWWNSWWVVLHMWNFCSPFSLCRSPLFYGLLKRPFLNTWDFPGISWIGDWWSCSEFFWILFHTFLHLVQQIPQGCFHCTSIFVACRNTCVNTKEDRPLRGLYWHLKFESYPMTFFSILMWPESVPTHPQPEHLGQGFATKNPHENHPNIWGVSH